MDIEEIKSKIDLDKIESRIIKDLPTQDYIIDDKGNAIIRLSPLEFKLIEKIKDLEERIKDLEDKT